MKQFKNWTFLILGILFLGLGSTANAAREGDPAPDFTGTSSRGKTVKLSTLKGKWVVLEWHNPECPFVQSQYKGKMQKLQIKWTQKGVKWFSVITYAEGLMTADKANADALAHYSQVTATLMDSNGIIGHAYDAKTTPHMFVINPKGVLVYNGAIDNAPRRDKVVTKITDDVPYINYVDQALSQGFAGKNITIPTAHAYGCYVEYPK
jgi:alkyl hydroperoxide reductase subunit AhpC